MSRTDLTDLQLFHAIRLVQSKPADLSRQNETENEMHILIGIKFEEQNSDIIADSGHFYEKKLIILS